MLGPPARGIYNEMPWPRSKPASGTIRASQPGAIARSYRNSHTLHRLGYFDVEERGVLLGAEEVALAEAAARAQPADGELDRVGRLEHHEVGHAGLLDPEQT